jgi:hypothetical protein
MALLDDCDRLFAYLCQLNRQGRNKATVFPDAPTVRTEVTSMLQEIKAKSDPNVYTPTIRAALEATADWMISASRLPWTQMWQKRGFDPTTDNVNLDQEFWTGLDKTLAEPGTPASDERLEVYAACIGLGYVGEHIFLPEPERFETIRREMRKIWTRIKEKYDFGERQRITPQTYEWTETDDLRPPRVSGTMTYAIVLSVMVIGLLVAQFMLYRSSRRELAQSLERLDQQMQATGGPATGGLK